MHPPHVIVRSLDLLAALVLASACADEPVEVLGTGPPTYYEDVTPILARHCWCCHRSGGLAYSLTEPAEVAEDLARSIASIEDGLMPPGAAQSTAECVALAVERPSPADVTVLRAWNEAGRPLGDPWRGAAIPPACGVLDGPVRRFTNGGYTFTGATGFEARCFVLDASFGEDQFLVGAHVDPGSPIVRAASVHVAPLDRPAGASFECPTSSPLVTPEILAVWGRGSGDFLLPSGLGIRVRSGATLMLRVHYDTALADEPLPARIETAVSMALVSSVAREASIEPIVEPAMSLEPGIDRVEARTTSRLLSGTTLHAIAVSMYSRGRSARVELTKDERTRCLLHLPSWPSTWIRAYRLASEIDVSGETLHTRCIFDTSDASEPIPWGDPPSGEQCLTLLLVTRP